MNPLDVMDYPIFFVAKNAINVANLSRAFGLNMAEMAILLQRKRQQVNLIYKSQKYSPRAEDIRKKFYQMIKTYNLLRALLKVPQTEEEMNQLTNKIFQWFRIPNPAYAGKSPFELIASGDGDTVIESLEDRLYGVPA